MTLNPYRLGELLRRLFRSRSQAVWHQNPLRQGGKVIGVILVSFVLAAVVLFWHLDKLGETLAQTLVLQGADINVAVIEEVRKYYSSNVVARLAGKEEIEVTHDYAMKTHAIPLPATMSIELGKLLRDQMPGAEMRLYSDYPFPWRKEGGPRDAFEREALTWLRDYPDKPYYRFEGIAGDRYLRYAKADVMTADCLGCHNNHPDSPKRDWHEGDVRGVLEVVRPISGSAILIQKELQGMFGLFAGVSLLGLGGMGVAMHRIRRAAVTLGDLVRMRTAELEAAKEQAEHTAKAKAKILCTVQAFFIGLDQQGIVTEWTLVAERLFGISLVDAIGRPFTSLPIQWNWEKIREACEQSRTALTQVVLDKFEMITQEKQVLYIRLTFTAAVEDQDVSITVMGEDVTDRLRMEHELVSAQKLESIGHLAAGIAHEINTPIQFVGDNIHFLDTSFTDINRVLDAYRQVFVATKSEACSNELLDACEAAIEAADLDYLLTEIPKAVGQSSEGIHRVAKIVRAMKEFAHPGGEEKTAVDLNKAIESTVTVARNEWKYVADMTTDLAPDLPLVPCLLGEFNQVILNMIVNAAHAIGEVVKDSGQKGLISIASHRVGECVEIRLTDTGAGIPEEIRNKIFDPFFTTKEVGKGTGQGLAIARSVVVDKHRGAITVESQVGKGTTFIIRLPITDPCATSSMEKAA
ncbi:MAG TPA: ATP-binding protein [Nitrospira sp.]|nr:ATP-binding protein [Nitrospira sp.]